MKSSKSLVVSINTYKDLDNIKDNTKYININLTNCDNNIIDFFIKNGNNYLYSEIIEGKNGYVYVPYEKFLLAEEIIGCIYAEIPNNLSKLSLARYLYTKLAKYVSYDINTIPEKNEDYTFSKSSNINNIWGSLAKGCVNETSAAKIYYYICKRMDIEINIIDNTYNKIKINNQIFNVNFYKDIPYLEAKMKTKYFGTYNEDTTLDKKVKYIKKEYNNYYIDLALKNIDYIDNKCVENILNKTSQLIEIENVKPEELSIIFKYIFDKYCPNYNIKINNLYLNTKEHNHFLLISYFDNHYSYNYKDKKFVKVNDYDLIDNLKNKKIGIYLGEIIPSINNCLT